MLKSNALLTHIWISGILIVLLGGCKYAPFVKYYNLDKDTDLPKFGKYSRLAGANNTYRSSYDVTKYDWAVSVFPEEKSITGRMEVWFDMVNHQDTLMFDLYKGLKIDSITCKKPLHFKRKRNIVYLIYEEDLLKDSQMEVTFYYHGKKRCQWNELVFYTNRGIRCRLLISM